MKKKILEYIIIGICMMPNIELTIAEQRQRCQEIIQMPHDDSCPSANDGYCNDPPSCPTGTDATDCSDRGTRQTCGTTDLYPAMQEGTVTQPINERGYKEIFPNTKDAYTIKSFVNTVSNVTYTTAIIYFWIHLIKTIRVIYNDLEGFSYFVWTSLKLSLHITTVLLYLYILFYDNEETENNGVYLMFIIGSIEYMLDQ